MRVSKTASNCCVKCVFIAIWRHRSRPLSSVPVGQCTVASARGTHGMCMARATLQRQRRRRQTQTSTTHTHTQPAPYAQCAIVIDRHCARRFTVADRYNMRERDFISVTRRASNSRAASCSRVPGERRVMIIIYARRLLQMHRTRAHGFATVVSGQDWTDGRKSELNRLAGRMRESR